MLSNIGIITRRELAGYFLTPIAYVFIVIFLILSGVVTFYLGGFFDRGQADLAPFFGFLPWLYLFLIPALTMRLWAEERKSGTVELLFTLPVTMAEAVVGKFLATWIFTAVALALTFPLWLTVNYLGDPDNGVIAVGYAGSLLMAGGYIAIGCCISALTRNQVIAFVIALVVCLAFVLSGFPMVLDFLDDWLPPVLLEAVASFSFLSHFTALQNGVVDARDLVFFISLICLWLFANAAVLEIRKA
jgi:ABC-2 type transport system permease protein